MLVAHMVEEAAVQEQRHFVLCCMLPLLLHPVHRCNLSILQWVLVVVQMEQPDQGMEGDTHVAGTVVAVPQHQLGVDKQDIPLGVVVSKKAVLKLHNNLLVVGIHCCMCSHFC